MKSSVDSVMLSRLTATAKGTAGVPAGERTTVRLGFSLKAAASVNRTRTVRLVRGVRASSPPSVRIVSPSGPTSWDRIFIGGASASVDWRFGRRVRTETRRYPFTAPADTPDRIQRCATM